jgi:glycosyltransferase involved in cell wall biosynthesis
VIEHKICNFLALRYPAELVELIVVSDGSTDGTDGIVSRCADPRVRLLRQEPRAGKSSALNLGVAAAQGEVLVFSDANSMFAPEALEELMAPLSSPEVGAVSGVLVYQQEIAHSGEDLYWRYEQVVKRLESRLGALLGANGAIFAIRKELMPRLRPLDVNDFRIAYQAMLEGRQVFLNPAARAAEEAAGGVSGELGRKVRIMSRALPMFLSLLGPTLRQGRIQAAWQLISHKLMRESQALFFAAMLLGAGWGALAGGPFGKWAFGLQLAGYAVGTLGWLWPQSRRLLPIRFATYVTMIAVASAWAMARWLAGRNTATWRRTERSAVSSRGGEGRGEE